MKNKKLNKNKKKFGFFVVLCFIFMFSQINNVQCAIYYFTQYTNSNEYRNSTYFDNEFIEPDGYQNMSIYDCQLPYNLDSDLNLSQEYNNYNNTLMNYNRYDNCLNWGTKYNPNLDDFDLYLPNYTSITDFNSHNNVILLNDSSSTLNPTIGYVNNGLINNISFFYSFSYGNYLNDFYIRDISGQMSARITFNYLPNYGMSVYNGSTRISDVITSLSVNTWYYIFIEINNDDKTFSIYLNNQLIALNYVFNDLACFPDRILFASHTSHTPIFYYDAICINSLYEPIEENNFNIVSNDTMKNLEIDSSGIIQMNLTDYTNDKEIEIDSLMELNNNSLLNIEMYNNQSEKIVYEFDTLNNYHENQTFIVYDDSGLDGYEKFNINDFMGNITIQIVGVVPFNYLRLSINETNDIIYYYSDDNITYDIFDDPTIKTNKMIGNFESFNFSFDSVTNYFNISVNNIELFNIAFFTFQPLKIIVDSIVRNDFDYNNFDFDMFITDDLIQINRNDNLFNFTNIFIDDFLIDFIFISNETLNIYGFDSNYKIYYNGTIDLLLEDTLFVKSINNIIDITNNSYNSFEYLDTSESFYTLSKDYNSDLWNIQTYMYSYLDYQDCYLFSEISNEFNTKSKINGISLVRDTNYDSYAKYRTFNFTYLLDDYFNKNEFNIYMIFEKSINYSITLCIGENNISFIIISEIQINMYKDGNLINQFYDSNLFDNDYIYLSVFREASYSYPSGYRQDLFVSLSFNSKTFVSKIEDYFDFSIQNFQTPYISIQTYYGTVLGNSYSNDSEFNIVCMNVYDNIELIDFYLPSILYNNLTQNIYDYGWYLPFDLVYNYYVSLDFSKSFDFNPSIELETFSDTYEYTIQWVEVSNVWLNASVSYYNNEDIYDCNHTFEGSNSTLEINSINIEGNVLTSFYTGAILDGYRYDYFFDYHQSNDFALDISANLIIYNFNSHSDSISIQYYFLVCYFVYLYPENQTILELGLNSIAPLLMLAIFPMLFFKVLGKKGVAIGLVLGFIVLGISGIISLSQAIILSIFSVFMGVLLYKNEGKEVDV